MHATPSPTTSPCVPTLSVADIELPRILSGLYHLSYNLWWGWHSSARHLFARLDGASWNRYRNPIEVLVNFDRTRWEELLGDEAFLHSYAEVMNRFHAYMKEPSTWFARNHREPLAGPIAYLSMEYGIHQSLALYSGGLGILSGDHLKSASDLGVPLVAVGLAYRHGYFHQTLSSDGGQQHIYPWYDFSRLPLRPAASATGTPVVVEIPLGDRTVSAKVWVCQVGRVPLLLLDTDIPQNDPEDRPITGVLYVSGRQMRLEQELVLGLGGALALEALGIEPSAWHMNEGHCAFVQLDRLARETGRGVDFETALASVRANVAFTTHTPVPAGNETFDRALVARYLEPWAVTRGLDLDTLLDLGRAETRARANGQFNLTALALRTSSRANGVSAIHGEVSRGLWADLSAEEPHLPHIDAITNGVHVPTWLGREMRALWRRVAGHDWKEHQLEAITEATLESLPLEQIWKAHQQQKNRLGRFLRKRLRDQMVRHGEAPQQLRGVKDLFDEDALTIGFARRFATYKRAGLVFSQPEVLDELLGDPDRPVQLVYAGKAHPADKPGQALIREIFNLSHEGRWRGKVFFIEDYDMRVGQMLVQGCDVWLNNPRRPLEASGTSGQKAAMNGTLNLSILDGWWPEAFDGTNGWAIEALPEGDDADEETMDRLDAEALYQVLRDEVIPMFFSRNSLGLPEAWVERMRRSIATVGPNFSADRMLRDYVDSSYLPIARRGDKR